MAKLTSPLHSITAQGTIGKKITYSGSLGGARAYAYNAPRGTGTPARKSLYANGCAAWQLLTPSEKAAWNVIGKQKKISGFNAFMSNYLLTPQPAGIPWDDGTAIWTGGADIWS